MPPGVAKGLVDRWNDPKRAGLPGQIARRMAAGQPLDDFELGTHEGRIDLRGLVLPHDPYVPGYRPFHARGTALTDVDLSGAVLNGAIWDAATITNCVFDRADMTNVKFMSCVATDVSMQRCNLGVTAMTYWQEQGKPPVGPPTRWVRLDLSRAKFSRSFPSHLTFEAAHLERVGWRSSWFRQPHFTRCQFLGPVVNCVFDLEDDEYGHRGEITDCDWSEASLEDVLIYGAEPRSLGIETDTQPYYGAGGRVGFIVHPRV